MKKEKGITLIALVVTIVVLLILAGISIAMLTGDNGIISQAKKAKEATEQAKVEELVTVAIGSVISKNNGSTAGITPKMVADQINEDEKRSDVYAENETTFPTNIIFPKEKRKAIANLNVKNTDDTNQDEEEGKAVLMSCSGERDSDSPFLGNSSLQRKLIKSVKIQKSLDGHTKGDDSCWDVSEAQDGSILAWYTEEDVNGTTAYNVTIGSNARIKANSNSSYLFKDIGSGVSAETKIEGLNNLDTSNVINMSWIFHHCTNLVNIDISKFDTNNVSNMWGMFGSCEKLTSLNVKSMDTSNVTDMGLMFYYCSSLLTLDVSNFDTSKVENMNQMFMECSSLTNLDVKNFDTKNVSDISGMFFCCKSLTNLDLSNFNTSNVINMENMFRLCNKLTSVDLSSFDTKNVINMKDMFYGCSNLTKLDLNHFNTSKVTKMNEMFGACSKMEILNINNFDTSKVQDMRGMFYLCKSLSNIDISNFDTSNVQDMANMFGSCSNLTSIDVSNFNTSNVTSMRGMFASCSNLTEIDVSNFDTSNVIKMGADSGVVGFDFDGMFFGCDKLKTLNLKNFNISKVTSSVGMFGNLPTDVKIYVSTDAMKTWVLEQNSSLTNIVIEQ